MPSPTARPRPRALPPPTDGGRVTRSGARRLSRLHAALPRPGRRVGERRLPTRRPSAAAATSGAAVGKGLLLTAIVVAAVAAATGSEAQPQCRSAEHEDLKELLDLHRFSSGERWIAPCVPKTRG